MNLQEEDVGHKMKMKWLISVMLILVIHGCLYMAVSNPRASRRP